MALLTGAGAGRAQIAFKKIVLSAVYIGEGVGVADYNKDGSLDVAAGPYWFEGPSFTVKHKFEDSGKDSYDPNTYSPYYMGLESQDLNRDGWPDIIFSVGAGWVPTYWYENPKGASGNWRKSVLAARPGHEAAQMADLFKDGKLKFINMPFGRIGWSQPDSADPYKEWDFHPISDPAVNYGQINHGLGVGDVNGDGRNDIVASDAWYEQPASLQGDPVWPRHAYSFRMTDQNGKGGSQMYVEDLDGDGDNDIVASIDGHGWGLAWFENIKDAAGNIAFKPHMLMGDSSQKSVYGAAFSQLHSLGFADLDGDGLKDIVTGKRWWAHNNTALDPDLNGAPVLYWFKQERGPGGTTFKPFLIDSTPGSGTNMKTVDLNGDGSPDVIVSSKKGSYVYLSPKRSAAFPARPLFRGRRPLILDLQPGADRLLSVIRSYGNLDATGNPQGTFALILDAQGGEVIRLRVRNIAGSAHAEWNGRDARGNPVPGGAYFLSY